MTIATQRRFFSFDEQPQPPQRTPTRYTGSSKELGRRIAFSENQLSIRAQDILELRAKRQRDAQRLTGKARSDALAIWDARIAEKQAKQDAAVTNYYNMLDDMQAQGIDVTKARQTAPKNYRTDLINQAKYTDERGNYRPPNPVGNDGGLSGRREGDYLVNPGTGARTFAPQGTVGTKEYRGMSVALRQEPAHSNRINDIEQYRRAQETPGLYHLSDGSILRSEAGEGVFMANAGQFKGKEVIVRKPAATSIFDGKPIYEGQVGRTKTGAPIFAAPPKPKTVPAFDLFDENTRRGLTAAAQSGEYKTAGDFFKVPAEQPPAPRTIKDDLLDVTIQSGKEFRAAKTPREQGKAALKNLGAYSALVAVNAKDNVKGAVKGIASGAGLRLLETGLVRAAESPKLLVRTFGKGSLKAVRGVAAPAMGAAYTYDTYKALKKDMSIPDERERINAQTSTFSRVGIETVSFGIGYEGTKAIVPERAYSTSGPKGTVRVQTKEGQNWTVEGFDVNSPMAPKSKVLYRYNEKLTGYRGWKNGDIQTTVVQHNNGRVVKLQQGKDLLILSRQQPGERFATEKILRPGKKPIIKRTGPLDEGTGPEFLTVAESRNRRTLSPTEGVLVQQENLRSVLAMRGHSNGESVSGIIRRDAVETAKSTSDPTIFTRRDVKVRTFVSNKPKLVAKGKAFDLKAYTRKSSTKILGDTGERAYGISDTPLAVAPKYKVRGQNVITSGRLARTVDSAVFEPGKSGYEYNQRSLLARKGSVHTKGRYVSVGYGELRIGKQHGSVGEPLPDVTEYTPLSTEKKAVVRQPRIATKRRTVARSIERGTILEQETVGRTKQKTYVERLSRSRAEQGIRMPTSITKPLSRTSTLAKPVGRISERPGIVPASSIRPITAARPVQRPSVVSKPLVSPVLANTTKLTPTTINATRLDVARVSPTLNRIKARSVPFRPRTIEPPPDVPHITSFGRGGGNSDGSWFGRSKHQPKEYTPSLYALGFNIHGKKPSKARASWAVRPIVGRKR